MAVLSSITSFADGDPLSPTHLNSKLNSLVSNQNTINNALTQSRWFNVLDYGANGNDSADDTDGIRSAISAAANQSGGYGGVVYFPAGNYRVTSTLTLPSGFGNLWFIGDGHQASRIYSFHSYEIFDVNSGGNHGWSQLGLVGSDYTYLGTRASRNVGIYVRANSSGLIIENFVTASVGSYAIFFEAGAGSNTLINNCWLAVSFATTTAPRPESSIGHRGVDPGATPRYFSNIQTIGAQLFDVDGVNDLFASNCFGHNISLTTRSQNVFMQGVRLGAENSTVTIHGTTVDWHAGGHAATVVFDTDTVNCSFFGTALGGVTDLSTAGNNLIIGGNYANGAAGFRAALTKFQSTITNHTASLPAFTFSSESSLGLWRSEASVMGLSYGAFATNGLRSNITVKTGNYTATVNDQVISVNSSSTVTITLPAASTVTGQIYDIQRHGTQTVVITATSGSSFNNNSTMTLVTQFQSLTFQSYGSGYLAK